MGKNGSSTAAALARKPIRTAGATEMCFCGHAHRGADCEHCECTHFQLRPCTCGHPAERHGKTCLEKGCDCRRYVADRTPEFLLRRGVRAGEWQFIAKDRLRWLMRPDQPFTIRVWACGMLHAGRTRLAVKVDKNGDTAHYTPMDIVRDLNAVDPMGRATKHHVRRSLWELEKEGAVRRVGRQRLNARLYFYERPLASRTVEPEPVLGARFGPQKSVLGAKSGPQKSVSPSTPNHLQKDNFSHVRAALVKSLRKAFESALPPDLDLGAKSGYQKVLDEVLEEVLLVAKSGYQKLVLVAKSGPPLNKEVSSSVVTAAEEPREEAAVPAAAGPPPEAEPIAEALGVYGEVDEETGPRMLAGCRKARPDVPVAEIVAQIHLKAKRMPRETRNPTGWLIATVPHLLTKAPPPKLPRAPQAAPNGHEAWKQREAELRKMLEDPDVPDDDKALAREILGEQAQTAGGA